LMAARLTGYSGDLAVLYAAVVEFIHTATLVHDDIIDDSQWRRGQPSVHSRWGSDVTVLLGDYLYIKSMGLALTPDRLDIVRQLCDVTLRMIEGELYQLSKKGDVTISEDEHLDIVRRKTAYLFGGCARIGGILGEATPDQERALEQYGISLGMSFQLIDDLLDFAGDESALGKPVGGDLREGKITLPIIRLLQQGSWRHPDPERDPRTLARNLPAPARQSIGGVRDGQGAGTGRAREEAALFVSAIACTRRPDGVTRLHPRARSLVRDLSSLSL
jgi:octaprenyl-diphosphate synthase